MAALLATLVALAAFGGHPGHGSVAIVGTLLSVTPEAVTIEVHDVASATMKTVRVLVDKDTKYRVGKEPVADPSSYIGTRVIAAVDYEEGPTGETIYRATDIRLTKPKAKAR